MKTKARKPAAPAAYSPADGGVIAGIKLGPLSAPVRMILVRRGNVLVDEKSKRKQDDIEAASEVMFVASLSPEQRANHFRTSPDEWDLLVGEFAAGLPDHALEEFADAVAASNRTK